MDKNPTVENNSAEQQKWKGVSAFKEKEDESCTINADDEHSAAIQLPPPLSTI